MNNNFIDFDYASIEWRKNKKYLGCGIFRYKCNHVSDKTNKNCKNKRFIGIYCKYHAMFYKNNKIISNLVL